MDLHQPIERALMSVDAADAFDERAIALAVPRAPAGTRQVPGDFDKLPIQSRHGVEETSAHQIAAVAGDQRGKAEIDAEAFRAGDVVRPAFRKHLRHVGHQPDAESVSFRHDLDDIAAFPAPFASRHVHAAGSKTRFADGLERRLGQAPTSKPSPSGARRRLPRLRRIHVPASAAAEGGGAGTGRRRRPAAESVNAHTRRLMLIAAVVSILGGA